MKLLVDSEKDSRGLKVDEVLIVKLKSALLISKSSGNIQFQRTVLYSIGEIGKVAENGLLLITVISLLESYMTLVPSLKVVAFSKVHYIQYPWFMIKLNQCIKKCSKSLKMIKYLLV